MEAIRYRMWHLDIKTTSLLHPLAAWCANSIITELQLFSFCWVDHSGNMSRAPEGTLGDTTLKATPLVQCLNLFPADRGESSLSCSWCYHKTEKYFYVHIRGLQEYHNLIMIPISLCLILTRSCPLYTSTALLMLHTHNTHTPARSLFLAQSRTTLTLYPISALHHLTS